MLAEAAGAERRVGRAVGIEAPEPEIVRVGRRRGEDVPAGQDLAVGQERQARNHAVGRPARRQHKAVVVPLAAEGLVEGPVGVVAGEGGALLPGAVGQLLAAQPAHDDPAVGQRQDREPSEAAARRRGRQRRDLAVVEGGVGRAVGVEAEEGAERPAGDAKVARGEQPSRGVGGKFCSDEVGCQGQAAAVAVRRVHRHAGGHARQEAAGFERFAYASGAGGAHAAGATTKPGAVAAGAVGPGARHGFPSIWCVVKRAAVSGWRRDGRSTCRRVGGTLVRRDFKPADPEDATANSAAKLAAGCSVYGRCRSDGQHKV